MRKTPESKYSKQAGSSKKFLAAVSDHILHHLAFNNSFQANIITIVSTGKIIIANHAACKLLGYSRRELLTKSRSSIFDIKESAFKNLLKQRTAEGHSKALATAVKKNGRLIPSEITSAVFIDEDGIEKAITTIADMSLSILKQKKIDTEKDKIVAGNIALAKTKQKGIDTKRKKKVADNIASAKSKQKKIDIQKDKVSAYSIELAKSEQKDIDSKKKRIVADDIALAKSEQKEIDIKKDKIVADNIDLAISNQKVIDVKREKVVADDIALAKSEQKEIDIKKDKIVADNIDLAISNQKAIDVKREKVVADDIALAKSEQKEIDIKKDKIVADNIDLAISNQKAIDVKREKVVADDIALAKSEQKEIDIKKDKIVADNIAIAKSEQKKIDIKKDKIVADNIALAKSAQKVIDTRKEKIVADDIALAKSAQKKIDTEKGKIVSDNIILAQAHFDARLAENNEWIKYIARASYDVMWDWNIATGDIYVGDSGKEVFGYKLQNNTMSFVHFSRCLLPKERESIQKKLTDALRSGNKTWSDSFMFRCHDGSVASTNSRASIVRDDKGRAVRLIGAIQDVSRLNELEKKMEKRVTVKEERSDIFLQASKLSFDGIWDWNLLTNEFFLGEGFEELFGYSFNNTDNTAFDWSNHLHPDDKEAVEAGLLAAIQSSVVHWEDAYRFIRADGSVADVFGRASIIRDADGKASRMIGSIHDLSRQHDLEAKLDSEIASRSKLLTNYEESFKLIFNSSSDVLFDSDLIHNVVLISDAYEKEFGYKLTGNMTPADNWAEHIHPDDKERVMEDYRRMLVSEEVEWKCSYRFIRADSSVANVISSRIILRHPDGKAYRMIGSMVDVSKQKVLDEKLELEIKLKEKQIAEAREDARDTERSDIGRELHDNVNQLLGASKLYLDMAKRGGENSEIYLSRSSEYTLTAIEEIRKLTRGLTTDIIKNLGLGDAIDNICRDTMEINPVKISYSLENFAEESINEKFKMNLFRILQEQLNNILKHAKATEATIELSQSKESISLIIADNGVGFNTDLKQKGIGVANIKSRAAFYNGVAEFISQAGGGCLLKVVFPVTDALLSTMGENRIL